MFGIYLMYMPIEDILWVVSVSLIISSATIILYEKLKH